MKEKAHAIIILLRWLSLCIFLLALFTIFVYSPFYARSTLWLLNYFINPQVDIVAAQSQKTGKLSGENNFEPGSAQWIARRAYLYEVEKALQNNNGQNFIELQRRYQLLLQDIEQEEKDEAAKRGTESFMATTPDEESTQENDALNSALVIDAFDTEQNESLFQRYRDFLTNQQAHIDFLSSAAKLEFNTPSVQQPFMLQRPTHQPHAIVILGGGLTSGAQKGEIVVNAYTKKRLERAVALYQKHPLPLVLSGVEAPYMQKWLTQHQVQAQFLENSSMNTCENTRFSALLLQKQGGAPTVFLVTDAYHMPRSQRLFAMNGIVTQPIIAPLPQPLTTWKPHSQNLMHSRRATYEVLATLRDIWFGESNCREIP